MGAGSEEDDPAPSAALLAEAAPAAAAADISTRLIRSRGGDLVSVFSLPRPIVGVGSGNDCPVRGDLV